ncbi:MAG: ABC transporter permease [Actinomycetales bacterium]|nr:ABC transporter permease [Actinomycetales bacterium]
MTTTTASPPRGGFAYRHPRARLAGLLAAPMAWLVIVYLGSLAALFLTAFWTVDGFTSAIVRTFTLDNFIDAFTTPAYLQVMLRTLAIAIGVTILCLLIGVPVAYFMARIARPKWQPLLVALILTPLWASYLVKVYAWRAMLSPEQGVVAWLLSPLGLSGPGFGEPAIIITLTYLWLPYMILPVYAGFTRLPSSQLDASADLGAKGWRTFRSVIVPTIFPTMVAGSIFTFSLSLGDYITAQIVGGKIVMLGNVVQQNYVTNLPFAAAFATIPVIIVLLYLAAVRRTGALDNL